MRAHDVVTCALVYLAVGSIVWLALYSAGLVQQAYAARHHDPKLAIVLASIGVVVVWPVVVWVFLAGLIEGARR